MLLYQNWISMASLIPNIQLSAILTNKCMNIGWNPFKAQFEMFTLFKRGI